MNSFRTPLVIVGALIASVTGAAAPALANAPASTFEAAQVRVNYADLNLQTEAGQKTLATRINSAAGRVCRVSEDPNSRAFRQCREQARQGAHQDLAKVSVIAAL